MFLLWQDISEVKTPRSGERWCLHLSPLRTVACAVVEGRQAAAT